MSQMSTDIVVANVRGWCKQAPEVLKSAERAGTTFVPFISYQTRLRPYPLLGVISSWNAPFHLSAIDFIPALLAGCAAVVKPSSITPRFVAPVMETIKAVPELANVLSYVLGDGQMGQRMVDLVDIICFTGSVENGRKVGEACSKRFIPVFLELGGKDPVIVTATADLERATSAVIRGAVGNTGQVCFSVERIYVDAKTHDAFVDLLGRKAALVKFNYPDPEKGDMGPFISMSQADVVDAQLDDALAKGARIVEGGKSINLGGGRYMPATVLVDVTHDMLMMQEETFGPLMPVVKYSSEEEAIRLANDSTYGLSAAVIAGTEEEAMRIALRLDAGTINVQDVCLTFAKTLDVETNASKFSGIGGARTGPASILRFVRKRAYLSNKGPVMTGSL
jgi:aldehyde dehydrogenase (NAD+)